jgi:hypothetical protein
LKRILCKLIILFFALQGSYAQDCSIGAGVSYGGPLPVKAIDSSNGKPKAGLMAGASFSIALGKYFTFSPALYYSFHGVDYSQSFTRDTMITVVINNHSGQVPSFYTAYVNGAMRLHYIDIPLLLNYRYGKSQLMLGPYFSFLFAGKDVGNVRVVIGNGGFYEDQYEEYNNFYAISKVEYGIMIGSNMPIYKKLSIEIQAMRSLRSLYRPDKITDRGQRNVKMFNTFVKLGLVYKMNNILSK